MTNGIEKLLAMRSALLGGAAATKQYITTGKAQEVIYPYTRTFRPEQAIKQDITIKTADVGVPQAMTDVYTKGAWWAGLDVYKQFWATLIGTPEEKIDAMTYLLPIGSQSRDILSEVRAALAKSEIGGKNYLTTGIGEPVPVDIPEFKFELPDIMGGLSSIAIIGIIALGGIYLLGKVIGGKK